MKYLQGYDIEYDYSFQCEIDEKTAERIIPSMKKYVSDTPWPDIPIASRLKSVRHPGWPSPTGYSDSDGNT